MKRSLALVVALSLGGCVAAAPTPSPSLVIVTASPRPAPTAAPTPRGYQGRLLYDELFTENGPLFVRSISLTDGSVREVASVAPKHDARFALSPDARTLAIYDKLDHHEEHTATWRLRLVDLRGPTERDLIGERTDPEPERPWDVGYSPDGALLLVSRRTVDRVEDDGARRTIATLPDGTIGVIFRDPAHPGLLVSQTADTYSLYLARDRDTVVGLRDRPLVGITAFGRRPGTDEVVELVTRFDGSVTLSLLRSDGTEERRTLQGPRVEGFADLAGTAPDGAYVVWPIAKGDPAALGVIGSALLVRVGYDGKVSIVDGLRDWGPFGPLGVSPDGKAVLVPEGAKVGGGVKYSLAVCCDTRPAPELLPPGDRDVIGWLPAR